MNGVGRGENKSKRDSKASVITRETIGMTLLLFSVVIFFIAVSGKYVFGDIGVAITAFFLGVFGFLAYPLLVLTLYLSVTMILGKGLIPAKWLLRFGLLLFSVFLIVHTATSERFVGDGYGAYLTGCWRAAEVSASGATGGGVIYGLFVYPIRTALSAAGAYVVFVAVLLLSVFYFILGTPLRVFFSRKAAKEAAARRGRDKKEEKGAEAVSFDDLKAPERIARPDPEEVRREEVAYTSAQPQAVATPRPRDEKAMSDYDRSREILFGKDPAQSYRENLAYDRDSHFNTRASRVVDENRDVKTYSTPDSPLFMRRGESGGAIHSGASYSERWIASALADKPTMPRRVNGESTSVAGGYTYSPANDVSYSQTPSYRAEPTKSEKPTPKRDYYEKDVPYREQYSVTPDAGGKEEAVSENPRDRAIPTERVMPEERAIPTERVMPEERAIPTERVMPEDRTISEESATPAERGFERNALQERGARERVFPTERDMTDGRGLRDGTRLRGGVQDGDEADDDMGLIRNLFPKENKDEREREEDSRFLQEPSRVFDAPVPEREERILPNDGASRSAADLFDSDDIDDADDLPTEMNARAPLQSAGKRSDVMGEGDSAKPVPTPKRHVYKKYIRPDISLFADYDDTVFVPPEEIERNSMTIESALMAFGIEVKVVKVTCGATVTRYDLEVPLNKPVNQIIRHDLEIAMQLRARDGVNMYVNRGNGTVSVEVPNEKRATVGIKSVLAAPEFASTKPGALMFALGKDIEGNNVIGNIVKMKHILVAGSTGSGKSVCLNTMLVSLISKYSPEDLRLILIDPKKSEFTVFEGLPHLMINEIVSDAQKAVMALNWAIKEMERRYELFQQKTREGTLVKSIDEYNANLVGDEQKLAKIVFVVDELADLMNVAKKDIEERIQRITQKARAAGIHMVIATQRPSVDVITGVIKSNLPTRVAFRVIQDVDSRTILDEMGAQKLLGNGDMLYRTEGMFNCVRVQGAFLSSEEVLAVVDNIKENNEAYFDAEISDYINNPGQVAGDVSDGDEDVTGEVDAQYIKALGYVVKVGSASISLIQRKCSVGYNHAGKIIEWMEMMGYISPFDGKAKARSVLLTKEEYESKYGSLD